MIRILLSTTIVFLFAFLATACNKDGDSDNPQDQNPSDTTQVIDPTITFILSGAITDTITYVMENGIVENEAILGSYSTALQGILMINANQLPMGKTFGIFGNRSDFGEGEFIANGELGFGGFNEPSTGIGYTGTSSTIIITRAELVQNVVQATYNAWGTFEATMENAANPDETILVTGEFSNITISVN